MANILPKDIDKWTITNGSITDESMVLHPGGSATYEIELTDLEYIPKAFKFIAMHDANLTWKNPKTFAKLDIQYKNGKVSQVLFPFNAARMQSSMYFTDNVALVESSTFSTCTFSMTNTLSVDLTIVLCELKPSLDLDESMYNNIEGMLPQLVYAYNDSVVKTSAGVDTQVLQLPLSIKQETNLLMHLSITGEAEEADRLSCVVKLDGEVVKSFPVKQSISIGDFYFGVPSLLAFVTRGNHLVTAHINAEESSVSIPKEGALLVVDGKGILGGATGEYPHAEVLQEILIAGMYNNFAQDIDITVIEPESYTYDTTIPSCVDNLSTEVSVVLTDAE